MRIGLFVGGYRSVLVALSFLLLLLAARAEAQAPTITATATSATTLSVQLGNYYASTRIEEKVGSNWSTISTSSSYTAARAGGTYTFRGYSCYPTNPSVCNYSSSAFVTLVGNSPPVNPSISATMSGTSVYVSWSAPSGATSYQLTRNGTTLSASGTSYTDSSVAVGASYTYIIKACNAYGCSSGASSSITTPTPAPTVSVSFSPNPATIGQNTTLSWSSTNATGCTGAPSTGSSGSYVYSVLTTSNWSYAITCTGAGGSQTTTAVLVVMPAAPSISVGMSGASVAVSWSAPSGATSYQLTRGGTSLSASGTSYTDSAVTPGTSYTYTVKACNSNGCSAGASASITVTAPVPVNPSISSSMSGSSVYLSWSAPTYTTSYQLVRGSTSLSASGTSYTDSGVSAGSGYTYTIKACNASGCSSGASTSITVPLATPSAPTVSASFLGASVSVSWSAPSGTSSYQLQRNGSTLSASGNSYLDTAISTGSYTYTVKACNATGQCSAAGSATVGVPNSAPLFEVNTSGSNTVVFLVGNTYSWHIDEQVGGSWTSVQTGSALGATQSYSITRSAGTYSYRIYNCYPVTDGCSTSSSKSVTVVGSTPPAKPTLNTAMSGTSVLASWNSVSGVASYVLRRNTTTLASTGTSYLDNSVTPGTSYIYAVKACNANGDCSAESTSSIAPPVIPAKPSISTTFSGMDLIVSWSAPTGVSYYQFRRNSAAAVTTTDNSYRETNLSSGATYSYGIAACNAVGQCSTEATTSATVASVPAVPVFSASIGAGVISVSWPAVSGASSYQLLRGTTVLNASGTSYSDTSVVAGTSYTYSVKACNLIGDCSTAATTTITYPAVPAIPQFTGSVVGTSVVLNWNAPTYTASYQLKRGNTTLSSTGTSYTDTSVSAGNTYSYTLKACNSAGLCSTDAVVTVELLPIPAAPTVSAVFKGASVAVSWNAPSGTSSYQLQRNGSTLSASGNSYRDTAISTGSYTYTVKACNATGQCSAAGSATVSVSNSAPLFEVNTSGTNTVVFLVGNTYSWHIDEQVGGNWTSVQTGVALGATQSYSITRPAGTYSYRIYNCYPVTDGCSTSSSQSVTLTGTAPPAIPTLSTSMSGTSVLASWNMVSGAASYSLTRNTSPLTPTGTSYLDSDVTPGTLYTYLLKACNATGECSAAATSTITPPAIPAVPSISSVLSGADLVVSWSSPAGAVNYQFRRNAAAPTTTTQTSYRETNVTSGTTYTYGIKACNSVGQCSAEATLSYTVAPIPTVPTISASVGAGVINVSWTAPSGAATYQLLRGTKVLSPSGTSYADSTIVPGETYTYSVKACNAISACSAADSVTITYPAVPAVPVLTGSVNGTSVILNWNAPTYTTSYQLKRDTTSLSPTGTTYTDSGVASGNSYTYTLKACNAAGQCSAAATATFELLSIPAVPTVSAVFKGASVAVSWNAPSGTSSYQLQRNGSTLSASGNSYRDTAISTGSYTYTVKACNATGQCSAAGSATVSVSNSAPLFEVNTSGTNTVVFLVGNTYSWHIDEQVGGNWTSVQTGVALGATQSYSITRPAGTYSYRIYNCYPVTDGCSTSSSQSVTLTGTAPPAIPTLSTSMSGTSVLASWNTVSGAASYSLTRNTSPLTPTGTSYLDSDVTPGTLYTYLLKACNATGECSAAATSTITPPAIPAVPSISSVLSGADLVVSWSSPAGAVNYQFRRNAAAPTTTTQTSYRETNVTSGTTYTYGIKACNSVGQCSAEATLSYTVAPIPTVPTISASVGAGVINVSWTAPSGAATYQLLRGTKVLSPSGTSYADSTIVPGETYTYSVKACNAISACSAADSVTITYPAVPAVPVLTGSVNGTSVILNWNAPTYTTSYQLKRDTTSLSPTGTTYTDSGVASGNSYTYTLKACNAAGQCSAAATATFELLSIPAVPTVSAVFKGASVAVSWNAPSGTSSYQLQRNGSTLSASGNSYRDTAISTGSYTYTVKACNATGQCSAAGSATVSVSNSAPLFEVNTSGTNTVVFLVGNTYSWHIDEQVGGNWTSVQTGVALGATQSYSITRPAGTYSYRIYNCYPVTDGCSTSSSQSVTLTGTAPPAIPTLSTSMSGTSVLASWNTVSGAASYSLTRNTSPLTPTGTSYLDSDVTPGTLYIYRLKACSAGGECSAEAVSEITVPTVLSTLYEAEDAFVYRGVTATNHPGYSGRGFVDYDSVLGSYVEWDINAVAAGTAALNFRYANGDSVATSRPMEIFVNGVSQGALSFTAGGSWAKWLDQTTTVQVLAGANKIRAVATIGKGGPNVDYLSVDGPTGSAAPLAPAVSAEFKGASIDVTWNAPSGAVSYKFERNGVPIVSSGTSYVDKDIQSNSGYLYSVKACNLNNQCSVAGTVTASVPDQPLFQVVSTVANQVQLIVGSTYSWYVEELVDGIWSRVPNLDESAISKTRTFLLTRPSGSYTYKLYNCYPTTNGCSTWLSNIILVSGSVPPAAPAVTAVVNGTVVSLSWTSPVGAVSYKLLRDRGSVLLPLPAATSYTDSLVLSGRTYIYTVQACNINGDCSSATKEVRIPPAVPELSLINVAQGVRASWTLQSGASYYQLVRNLAAPIELTGLSYVDSSVISGVEYTYSIRACNVQRECSAPDSATIVYDSTPVLPAPPSVAAIFGGASVTVSWDTPTGTANYRVQRDSDTEFTLSTNKFVDTTLNAGTHVYKVRACNAQDQCSSPGSATLNIPAGPYFDAYASGPTTITFLVGGGYSWIVQDRVRGSVQLQNGTTSNSVQVFTINRLPGFYEFALKNCVPSGECITSPYKSVLLTGDLPPSAPFVSAVVNGANIDVSWTESDGGVSYNLSRNALPLTAVGRAYSDTSVTPGETYTYAVSACNTTGQCSEPGIAIVNPPAIPAVPDNFKAVIKGKSVFLSWDASTGAVTYKLIKGESTPLTPSGRAYTDSAVTAGNTYSYSVAACNSSSLCSVPAKVSIVVPAINTDEMVDSPLLTNGQVNDPAPREKPQGPFIGSVKGAFRVNEMGAATYSIPVSVPEGIAGVTPQLGFIYSSQGGNGLLGKGWALEGLSGITRCRQTIVQDGQAAPITWTSADRFCLDGKRLMLASSSSATYGELGATYKTEIDTFVTVTAKGGSSGNPDYFEVQGKDGSLTTYGGLGEDASELRTSKGVLTWGLKYFADNVGNPIAYVYEGNTTNYRVKEIRYAFSDRYPESSNCGAFVQFGYEPRTSYVSGQLFNDDQSAYVAGAEIRTTERLSSVSVYNGGCATSSATVARIYNLGYAPGNPLQPNAYTSRIDSVTECSAVGQCYPATTFDWNKPNELLSYGQDFGSVDLGAGSLGPYQFMDINGNGMADMIWSKFSSGNWNAYYALDVGAASGTKTPISLLVNSPDSNGKNPPRFMPIDYNGDGRQDLLIYRSYSYNSTAKWELYLSVPTNDGWKLEFQNESNVVLPFANWKHLSVGDVDSDGLSDVIGIDTFNGTLNVYSLTPRFDPSDTTGHTNSRYYKFSNATVYQLVFGAVGEVVNNPTDGLIIDAEADNAMTMADFNADGKMDVAIRYKGTLTNGGETEQIAYKVFLATNNGQFQFYDTLDSPSDGFGHAIDKIIAADINGDGLADTAYFLGKVTCANIDTDGYLGAAGDWRCVKGEGDWYFRLNTGGGFSEQVLLQNTPEDVSFADMNHDGKMDFVSTKKNASGTKDVRIQYWSSKLNNLTAPELLFPSVDLGKNYQLIDTNGDAWPDAVSIEYKNATWNLKTVGHSYRSLAKGIVPSDQIQKITDGMGNLTNISYEPLGRSEHYSPIGDIKITPEAYQKCHGEIVNPYGANSGTLPAACEPAISYDINTTEFYKQINSPFLPLINSGQIDPVDRLDAPVLEVLGPMTIVSSVESTAPSTSSNSPGGVNSLAKNRVDYFYRHLRMQAGGRGMLGFESLITVDPQTGVKTETRYRQDWPYIGSPIETLSQTSDGKLLSRARNTWKRKLIAGANNLGNRYQPYIEKGIEESFAYNSDGSGTTIDTNGVTNGAALQTVTTDTIMSNDDYGNVASLSIKTEGGGDILVKSTVNDFSGSEWQKQFGRLKSSTVNTTRNGDADSARTVSFTYYPQGGAQNGMLHTETLVGTANETLVTTYSYDDWGNKTQVSVAGSGQARNSYTNYGETGRYLAWSKNDLDHQSNINARDPATGQVTAITDANGVTADVLLDDMGQEYLRVDASNAWTRTDTRSCSVESCPSGARFVTKVRMSGGGQTATYYDTLGRAIRSAKIGFDGTWIYVDSEYDKFGRVKFQSTPYFANSQPAGWTKTEYDVLGRIKRVTLPDNSVATSSYNATPTGMETVTTNAKSQTQTELRNGLGQLLKVTDYLGGTIAYTYTLKGDLLTATTDDAPSAFPNVASVTVKMCYDSLGRKIGMHDPDKGGYSAGAGASCESVNNWAGGASGAVAGWWHYRYNAFGELLEQRDPKGQSTSMSYDLLGRMDYRTAADESTTWFYDAPLGGDVTKATKGKLTQVISKASSGRASGCDASYYCAETTYDQLGRKSGTVVHLPDGQDHQTAIDYDSIGRAYQTTDVLQAVFSHSGTQTHFNQYGYAYRTVDLATMNGADSALSTVLAMNARGQVTQELRSNGAITTNSYNEQTGLLNNQNATVTGLLDIQNNTYDWDEVGNLKYRISAGSKVGGLQNKAKEEGFCYDGLNRLVATLPTRYPSCGGVADIKYDGLGNITKKAGVGDYVYDRSNGGPHAVTSVAGAAYRYDLNGNAISGDGRNFDYTSYDMAKKISRGGDDHVAFAYGPDHSRWQRIDVKGTKTTTTTYLGSIERIVTTDTSSATTGGDLVEWKRTVAGVVHTYKTLDWVLQAEGHDKRYLYTDHLGSVDAITNAIGEVTNAMSFDPWGARRNSEDWAAISAQDLTGALRLEGFANPVTTRGYTGHEMVDDYGIIHMNGRIYDARIGRFLQADPFIQAAANTQSYNRYSYVMNNPLNATDPSGYFSLRQFVGAIVAVVAGYVLCANTCTAQMYAAIGAASGAAQAAANGQNILQGALTGAISSLAFYGVGQAFSAGGQTFGSANTLTKLQWAASQGVVGGVMSVLQGGKFGHGFASAFVTKYTNVNDIVGTQANQAATRVLLAAIIGGTVSEMTGGKFANGATSAALMQLVNGENEIKKAKDYWGRVALASKWEAERIGSMSDKDFVEEFELYSNLNLKDGALSRQMKIDIARIGLVSKLMVLNDEALKNIINPPTRSTLDNVSSVLDDTGGHVTINGTLGKVMGVAGTGLGGVSQIISLKSTFSVFSSGDFGYSFEYGCKNTYKCGILNYSITESIKK